MIKKIPQSQISELVELLQKAAPEQIPFIEGPYFQHGENIAFGWYEKEQLIGAIRYCIQDIGFEQKTPILKHQGKVLTEAKINAFAVQADFRNRGIGKQLQLKVIEDAKQNGCSQLASYSTFDKVENYAVKLALGFCIQPEIQANGTMGCFFLMKLN